jgi:hypothetical protein
MPTMDVIFVQMNETSGPFSEKSEAEIALMVFSCFEMDSIRLPAPFGDSAEWCLPNCRLNPDGIRFFDPFIALMLYGGQILWARPRRLNKPPRQQG